MKSLIFAFISTTFIICATSKVICNNTTKFLQNRSFIRNTIKNNTSIFFIVSYEILDESLINDRYEHLFARKRKFYQVPMMIFESPIYSNIFDILIPNGKETIYFYQNVLHKSPVETISKIFLYGQDSCDKNEKIEMYQLLKTSNLSGCSHLFFTCRVSKTENFGILNVKKQILVLTKGEIKLSDSDINECLKKGKKIENPDFLEFDSHGFCICDDLEFYLNDCSDEIKKEEIIDENYYKIIGYGIIFMTFISLFVSIQIFDFMIEEMEKE
ncbi:hypothetical protein PVAND_017142 [Polypedilum vanderplanki]|uniref:Phosphatidylinositol-glycan biosynthesis class X protein n=1 Tax=Polypedilum vanderplanki TaxID=319348 RepID=A0A9J6BHR6_POLVA|nr:hypothetical protein PVAND_017142 [Polypedilum vanderplanki]